MKKLIFLSDIDIANSPKVRNAIDADTVSEYVAAYERKDPMPPPVLMHEPEHNKPLFIVDGRHRVAALLKHGRKAVEAEVSSGSPGDIAAAALSHNITHGRRRTSADKRTCVETAITHWPEMSDRALADQCHVDQKTVGAIRKALERAGKSEPSPKRVGRDKRVRGLPKKTEAPKGTILDRTGYPITEKLLPLWNRMGEVTELLRAVNLVKNVLIKASKEDDPLWRQTFLSKAISDLQNVHGNLSIAAPYAVCCICQGHPEVQPKGICRGCKGRGLMSKFHWDRVPDNLKKIREKTNESQS